MLSLLMLSNQNVLQTFQSSFIQMQFPGPAAVVFWVNPWAGIVQVVREELKSFQAPYSNYLLILLIT